MFNRDLIQHAPKLRQHIAAGEFQETDEGVLFPGGGLASGEYHYISADGTERIVPNKVTIEGLNYLLGTGLKNASPQTNWYLALFSGGFTPTDALTAATFPATASEIVSGSEGYSESTRQLWVSGAVAAGQADNMATKASFTIVTASSLTIRGAALMSESIKGSTSGVLLSCARFGVDEIKNNGSTFQLGYRFKLRAV